MDPTSREDLSALMDGELAAEPTRFLLRRLEHDPGLSATWSRWHLIRACLVAEPSRMSMPTRDAAFAARVASAVGVEAEPRARQYHWARYVGGGAIAAGVAVAALMLNAPSLQVGTPAPVAESRSVQSNAPGSVAPTSLAETAPTGNDRLVPPWMLSRQPTVLSAQPASANIIYGAGLMQPDYLRRATYARDAALPYASGLQSAQPFSIVVLPPSQDSRATAAGGH